MARPWESIICYEDRSEIHTSRWRLSGIATKEGSENTDSGILWLEISDDSDTVTANLYKAVGLASSSKVATGTADISDIDGTGENSAQLTLEEANSSGISGSFWLHTYESDPAVAPPLIVALCVDEDMDALHDGIELLPGYDTTNGCAEFIRIASEDVMAKVMAIYADKLGGYGAAEAWYITDADRSYPDLRCISNPAQLRLACTYRALAIALRRSHDRTGGTMYSEKGDKFQAEYETAMMALVMAFKGGDASDAIESQSPVVVRQVRV